jgi:hypothetical protein
VKEKLAAIWSILTYPNVNKVYVHYDDRSRIFYPGSEYRQ